MPNIALHPAAFCTRVLICGDTGSGKTGLLATLANAGFRVHVIDLDNGVEIAMSYLTPEGAKNFFYETLDPHDKKTPERVWQLINHWKTKTEDHGPVNKFGDKDVIVIDSITFLASSCLMLARDENGDIQDERQIFKKAGPAFEAIINRCTQSPTQVPCNVVMNTHLRLLETATGTIQKIYPNALGKTMSRDIGRYFNNVWKIELQAGGKRVLRTDGDHLMALKSSAPNIIKPTEDFDLAAMFGKVRTNALKLREIFEKKS